MAKRNKRENKSKDWPCRMCGECCVNIPIEDSLVNQMRDKFQRNVIKEFSSPGIIRGPRYLTIKTSDDKCVFLDFNNKCVIYEHRPSICQDFGRRPGPLECVHITPSGRIRTPEESKKIKIKINRLQNEMAAMYGDFDEKMFGVHYISKD
ncbi:MAG: YkgJ family cysteine cluster protein [Methanoregula sp.]|uniref:YkgJ family cysteine cluster protein n=1 Tax=Methanoregula sp. TaxID=2052170 RepID=UPI003C18537E